MLFTEEELNDYFQTKEIWLMKNKTEQAQHLYLLLDGFRKISFLIWPVMPEIAEQILIFFNLEPKKSDYDKPLTTAYPNDRAKFFPKKTKKFINKLIFYVCFTTLNPNKFIENNAGQEKKEAKKLFQKFKI